LNIVVLLFDCAFIKSLMGVFKGSALTRLEFWVLLVFFCSAEAFDLEI